MYSTIITIIIPNIDEDNNILVIVLRNRDVVSLNENHLSVFHGVVVDEQQVSDTRIAIHWALNFN